MSDKTDNEGPPDRFALPARLERKLGEVHSYWQGLKRGQADIPFADDVKLAPLGRLADSVLLIDVFEGPERFRFGIVGEAISNSYGTSLEGLFVDEVPPAFPLDEFSDQCRATTLARAPTYQHAGPALRRLLLPLWGDGHISMLLGAIVMER
jgi:hypothetical protein